MQLTAKTRVSEMRNFNPGLHERVDVRTILTEPKFLVCKDNQIFLLMLLFCALPEHESSAINFVNLRGQTTAATAFENYVTLSLFVAYIPGKTEQICH